MPLVRELARVVVPHHQDELPPPVRNLLRPQRVADHELAARVLDDLLKPERVPVADHDSVLRLRRVVILRKVPKAVNMVSLKCTKWSRPRV